MYKRIQTELTNITKLLLLSYLLRKDHVISDIGLACLKELIIRKDKRAIKLLEIFEEKRKDKSYFLDAANDIIDTETKCIFDTLYMNCSLEQGKNISKKERKMKILTMEKSLIYGEIDYVSFYQILKELSPKKGQIFYDLGSGTGKAVFLAHLNFNFYSCKGIEILQGLHQKSKDILNEYKRDVYPILFPRGTKSNGIDFLYGSFVDIDWSDGDICFANSTCFDENLISKLSTQAELLNPGSIFITFTKPLTSSLFEIQSSKRLKMSWGPATVFIHKRLEKKMEEKIFPCS